MTQRKKGLLPKIEILIIGVFFISFLAWTIPKCSNRVVDNEPKPTETAENQTTVDTLTTASANNVDSVATLPVPTAPALTTTVEYSSLYITIDNLKMRRSPELKADVVAQLPLFEKVYFMNEVTDSLYELNLGYEVAKEPWVKVRTKKGKEGWVYGAGVNYYKKKRSGVME